jgi:hypothetical protein
VAGMKPTNFEIKETLNGSPREILTYVNVLKISYFSFVLNDSFLSDATVTMKG